MNNLIELAEAGYDAYFASREGKTYDGKPMPTFKELPYGICLAWQACAKAIKKQVESDLSDLGRR
jgi:hypothetical protein